MDRALEERMKSLAFWLEMEVARYEDAYKDRGLQLPPQVFTMDQQATDIRQLLDAARSESRVRAWANSETKGKDSRFWRLAKKVVLNLLNASDY